MATHYGTWTYAYDDLGQLTHAVLASTDPEIPNQDLTYIYDGMGNRVRTVENEVVTEYAVNSLNQYSQAGSALFGFDDDGNVTSEASAEGTNTLRFNPENRLIEVSRAPDACQYNYDALGSRLARITNGDGTWYLTDPQGIGDVVAQFSSGGRLSARYQHGHGLVGRTGSAGEFAAYTFDAVGNVQELVLNSDTVESRFAYKPFGEVILRVENVPSPFNFVGEFGVTREVDSYDLMRKRFYSSRIGRFLSQDVLALSSGDINLYRYASNDPTLYVDVLGSYAADPCDTTMGKIGSVLGGIDSVASQMRQADTVKSARQYCSETTGSAEVLMLVEGKAKQVHCCNGAIQTTPSCNHEEAKPTADIDWPNFWEEWPHVNPTTKILIPIYAWDPNQKLVLAGVGERGYVPAGTLLPYRVDFENDTNATAPAQAVFVTDRLSNLFDWPSFELTELGFGDERVTLPRNTQHFETNMPVTINGSTFTLQIQAGIRLDSGEVFCTFRSLDLDTDLPPPATAGFLPPEDGTGRGQGFVAFLVRAKVDLPTGTEIRNVALVDFDGRETVATNQKDPHDPGAGTDPAKEALVTLDTEPPVSSVTPLPPAVSVASFPVSWTGADSGSGIVSYDIHVSTNGGPWGIWLNGTTNTTETFTGRNGRTYAFFSIARDLVGYIEAAPGTADQSARQCSRAAAIIACGWSERHGRDKTSQNSLEPAVPHWNRRNCSQPAKHLGGPSSTRPWLEIGAASKQGLAGLVPPNLGCGSA